MPPQAGRSPAFCLLPDDDHARQRVFDGKWRLSGDLAYEPEREASVLMDNSDASPDGS